MTGIFNLEIRFLPFRTKPTHDSGLGPTDKFVRILYMMFNYTSMYPIALEQLILQMCALYFSNIVYIWSTRVMFFNKAPVEAYCWWTKSGQFRVHSFHNMFFVRELDIFEAQVSAIRDVQSVLLRFEVWGCNWTHPLRHWGPQVESTSWKFPNLNWNCFDVVKNSDDLSWWHFSSYWCHRIHLSATTRIQQA